MQSIFGGGKPNRGLRAIFGLLVAGTLLGTALPAEAHGRRDRHNGHRGGWSDDWGRHGHRDRWDRGWERRYHRPHHYRPRPPVVFVPPPVVYAPPPIVYAPRPYYVPRPSFNFHLSIP